MIWMLGLLLQIWGIVFLNKNDQNFPWTLKKINQLQPTIAVILFLLSFISLILFLFIDSVMSGSKVHIIVGNGGVFVSTVIFMSILSILISTKLSELFCKYLKELECLVTDKAIENNIILNNATWFEFSEFKAIKKLVYEAFQLKNETLLKEKILSNKAMQVAHDIRSPLIALMLSFKDPKQKHITEVENICNRINEIANDLLDFFVHNKLIDTPIAKSSSVIDMIPLTNEIYEEFAIRLAHTQISINLDISSNRSLWVNANSGEFKRSLSNIINNSIESFRGSIEGCITIRGRSNYNLIELSIEDNGCGISNEHLKDIFLEGVTINKMHGTGLGLSYVSNVIKSWGAQYEISSEKFKGTIFKYLFKSVLNNKEDALDSCDAPRHDCEFIINRDIGGHII